MPLSPSILRALESIFPGDALITRPEETLVFGADASRKHALPMAVVRPENTEQVAELLRLVDAERIPIYPRGRGTNRVGGCVPGPGGIVVSTTRMNRIVEISVEDFVAVVQPGAITGDLAQDCRTKGLFYAPDPASARFSTIGGNLAQNAGGMRAVKYGTTRDWALGLTVVLPGGQVISVGSRCHKDVAGLDLVRLFVGSEGTLGFITEATLKVLPLPQAQASLLAVFAAEEDALRAAAAVFAAGILPASMEFMSQETLTALENMGSVPWPAGSAAALLLRLDGFPETLTPCLVRIRQAVTPFTPVFFKTADTPEEEEILWEPRRKISQAVFHFGQDKLSDDIAVPRGRIGEAVARIRQIGQELGVTVVAFGHLGDGNLHVDVMHDASDADQAVRAEKARQAVLALTLSLGGSISGEHGVGLSKLPWLEPMRGPETIEVMRRVKSALDPNNIMNPGKAY